MAVVNIGHTMPMDALRSPDKSGRGRIILRTQPASPNCSPDQPGLGGLPQPAPMLQTEKPVFWDSEAGGCANRASAMHDAEPVGRRRQLTAI